MAIACGLFLLLLDPNGNSFAQAFEDAAALDVEARFDRIERMLDAVEGFADWDRDGLLFRIDEEILALHGELGTLTSPVQILPAENVSETPTSENSLQSWLDRALALSVTRVAELGDRINVELAIYDEFSGSPESIISRAFVQDLRHLRLRHLTMMVDQIESRSALGLTEATAVREQLEDNLALATDRLVGQIRLDAMTLEELHDRIAADPTDEPLRSALRAVERKQTGNLTTATGLIALLSRMNQDTRELRALQAQQRGLLGAEILDAEVFMSIVDDRLEMARDGFILSGPVWLLRFLAFVAVLLLAWLIARGAREIVRRITQHRSVELGDLRERSLVSLAYSVVLLVGVVLALSALGVSLVPLLAGLGVASIIVGLALQESLGNLAAGGMILVTRPFDLHDQIKVGNAEGKVKDMSLVATTVASHDNKMLVIPNRQVWSSTITNFTRAKLRRVDIEVSIPYGTDLAQVERLLRECIETENRILDKPAPLTHFGDISETTISFWVRVWVNTADVDPVSIALKRSIVEHLRATGIDSGLQTS